ncbi:hypothetical protein [Cysteiniphilum sp. 6C5]|uniref:hypothetical protein n=1 Tax=unclassified Cysteiniphilum TaxID=2610889 RepID=UPI003F8569B4
MDKSDIENLIEEAMYVDDISTFIERNYGTDDNEQALVKFLLEKIDKSINKGFIPMILGAGSYGVAVRCFDGVYKIRVQNIEKRPHDKIASEPERIARLWNVYFKGLHNWAISMAKMHIPNYATAEVIQNRHCTDINNLNYKILRTPFVRCANIDYQTAEGQKLVCSGEARLRAFLNRGMEDKKVRGNYVQLLSLTDNSLLEFAVPLDFDRVVDNSQYRPRSATSTRYGTAPHHHPITSGGLPEINPRYLHR